MGASGHETIIKGSDRVLTLKVFKGESALDMTGATGLKAIFIKGDSTLLELITPNVTQSAAGAGEVQVTLSAANTALLAEGENQTIELEFTLAAKLYIVQFIESYTVLKRLGS
jgi:hypothetical protein